MRVILGALCVVCMWPNRAHAGVPLDSELSTRVQYQALLLGSLGDFGDGFGGLELQANASKGSFGAAIGLRFDRVALPKDGAPQILEGGHVHLALQWRPLHLLHRNAYQYVDVHADLGFLIGGLDESGTRLWRGAIYTGSGLDVCIPLFAKRPGNVGWRDGLRRPQLVFTVQYRHFFTQSPGSAPEHELLVGAGIRHSF
jgi:hypothetical protein